MALADTLAPFLWGAGGSKKTPEQVAREREIAAALMQGGMDYSPVDHWLQGAARAAQGGVGALKDRWANEAETAGRAGYQQQWDSVFGGGQTAAVDPVAAALVGAPQTASDATAAVSGAPADWLNYANQGATRSLPLNDQLVNALGFLPELGVTMEVFSGGQPEAGQGPRVGSERHDHGNAADVFFYKDGQKLDWANPEHQPLFQEIVRRGKAAGITGFGAGDGYMQPGSMHLGFGPEAVWGAGGKGENAPDWLRSAFSGAPAGAAPMQTAQAGGQPSIEQLIGLSSDPWANESQQQILQTLMGQELKQQDPMYQLQMQQAQQGLTKGELEIAALLNPQTEAPKPIEVGGVLVDPVTYQPLFDSRQPSESGFTLSPGQQRFDAQGNPIASAAPGQADAPKPIEVGGVLLDPVTFQPIFDSRQSGGNEPTSAMQNYEYLISRGMPPEQAIERAFGGGQTINVGGNNDIGTIPSGMMVERDPAGNVIGMKPIPGGPAEAEAAAAAAQANARGAIQDTTGNIVAQDIDRALAIIEQPGILPTTGFGADWLNGIGGTTGNDLRNLLNTVKANTAFDQLQQMRDASPTGGALGGVSAPELTLLESAKGALEQSQSPQQLKDNLIRVQNIYLDIVHGPGNGPQRKVPSFEQGAASRPASAPAQAPVPAGDVDAILKGYGL